MKLKRTKIIGTTPKFFLIKPKLICTFKEKIVYVCKPR